MHGLVDKQFEQQYSTQNASCEVKKRRQSILNMKIESDSEDEVSISNIEKAKKEENRIIGKSRTNIIQLRLSELNVELKYLQESKIAARAKLANLIEYIKPDHIRFTILAPDTNKVNKLFSRSL